MVKNPSFQNVICTNPAPETGTHTLACYTWGHENNPRVAVCIHGLARNARDFDFLAAALADDYRVIALDMPGRGKSSWLANPSWYNPATYIADILHVLKVLEVERVDWIGTSMGGIIAMLIASQPLGLIKRMVLNDIGHFLPASALSTIANYVNNGGNQLFVSRETAETFLKDTYQARWGLRDPVLWDHFVMHSLRQEKGAWRLHYDPAITAAFKDDQGNPKALENMDLWGYWEKITCPIFLIRGQNSEVLTHETVEKMRASGKIGRFLEIPGCAHAPSLMEEDQIKAIKTWLLSEQ